MRDKPTGSSNLAMALEKMQTPRMRHSRVEAHIGQQEKATTKRRKLTQMAKQSRRRNRS